eukprot:TRINITY_DN7398_c0_g1_i1.p1 TRINITY_DN7398_c0_g1~~TRINITY_DN7398_c0_g1_i1.p1  ORF type:complete len:109 (+),score=18.54 TRINITY_DN7398_c0_g1_i1:230-556(+)
MARGVVSSILDEMTNDAKKTELINALTKVRQSLEAAEAAQQGTVLKLITRSFQQLQTSFTDNNNGIELPPAQQTPTVSKLKSVTLKDDDLTKERPRVASRHGSGFFSR